MNSKILRFLFTLIILLLPQTMATAQTLGGTLTQTATYIANANPDLEDIIVYSNWRWTDSKGVVHTFDGKTRSTPKYIYYRDMPPRYIGTMHTSLVNVQATDGSPYYLNATGGTGYVNGFGKIYPKYQVLSIIYSAPGTGSYVDYLNTSFEGNSTNTSKSFSNGMSFSATVGGDFFLGEYKTTYTGGWTNTVTNSNTISVNKTLTKEEKSNGQTDPAYGINHDYDKIVICLNPMLSFGASTSSTIASAPKWQLGTDPRDTAAGSYPDIVYLTVAQLKNPSLITNQDLLNRLQRTWAGPNQGLTTEDYSTILAANKFANDGTTGTRPSYDVTKDSNRFYQVGSIYYAPLQPGEGPVTSTGTLTYTNSNNHTSKAEDTVTASSSTSADVSFFALIGLNSTSNYTWTNTVSKTTSSGTTEQSSYSVPRPPSTWNVSKSEIIVWQDMVYGTFFFSY